MDLHQLLWSKLLMRGNTNAHGPFRIHAIHFRQSSWPHVIITKPDEPIKFLPTAVFIHCDIPSIIGKAYSKGCPLVEWVLRQNCRWADKNSLGKFRSDCREQIWGFSSFHNFLKILLCFRNSKFSFWVWISVILFFYPDYVFVRIWNRCC